MMYFTLAINVLSMALAISAIIISRRAVRTCEKAQRDIHAAIKVLDDKSASLVAATRPKRVAVNRFPSEL